MVERIPVDVGVVMYRQTPVSSWSLDVHQDGHPRRRYSLKTTDRAKALVIAREHARAIVGGNWNVAMSGTSVKSGVERFLKERCAKRHAEGTKEVTRVTFDAFLAWCAERRIESIDRIRAEHVEAFLDWRKTNRQDESDGVISNATLNKTLAWLRCLSRWAVKHGIIRADFTMPVERLPEPRRVKWTPSPEDISKIAAKCSPVMRDLLLFIVNAGGPRISDSLAVKAEDIDTKAGTVKYRGGKTDSEYVIRLNDVALEIVNRRLLQAKSGHLFQTSELREGEGGKMFNRRNVYRHFARAAKLASVKAGNPHAIRRCAITTNATVYSTAQVQAMANHASPATTAAHYIDKARVAVVPVPITG